MSAEITLAEFNYFMSERVELSKIQDGSVCALYLSIEAFPRSDTQGGKHQEVARLMTKAACAFELDKRYDHSPTIDAINTAVLTPDLHDIDATAVHEPKLIARVMDAADRMVAPYSELETRTMCSWFLDLIVQQFGYDVYELEEKFRVNQAFLIGPESTESYQRRMYATAGTGEDGNGLAGVRVPSNPTGPLPSIHRERMSVSRMLDTDY